ncbi:MAG: D-alanine--D-alanine ligase family protein [Actinomycetota bacterium]
MSERRRRVAVLFGGRSSEHEISCLSARSVIDALDPATTEVIPIGIARDGRWHVLPGPPALPIESGHLPEVLPGVGLAARLGDDETGTPALELSDGTRADIDVVFPVLHGPRGEDGAIQGLLELAGVPYVGASVLGSALGMDKAVQKTLWAAAGLPVVPYVAIAEHEWRDDPEGVAGRVAALGYPVFTKPASLGSSVGISKIVDPSTLDNGMEEAFRYEGKAVVERGIEPVREIECAVLGNDDPVASVCGEVVPRGHAFYDYDAKYLDENGAELRIPAPIAPALSAELQRLSVSAFSIVSCAGMARVDLFVRDDEVWINEINTIPGFTSISMYPKLWEASGLSFEALVQRLLDLAVERHEAERAKRIDVQELHGRVDP